MIKFVILFKEQLLKFENEIELANFMSQNGKPEDYQVFVASPNQPVEKWWFSNNLFFNTSRLATKLHNDFFTLEHYKY